MLSSWTSWFSKTTLFYYRSSLFLVSTTLFIYSKSLVVELVDLIKLLYFTIYRSSLFLVRKLIELVYFLVQAIIIVSTSTMPIPHPRRRLGGGGRLDQRGHVRDWAPSGWYWEVLLSGVLEICPRGNNKRIIITFPCSW